MALPIPSISVREPYANITELEVGENEDMIFGSQSYDQLLQNV